MKLSGLLERGHYMQKSLWNITPSYSRPGVDIINTMINQKIKELLEKKNAVKSSGKRWPSTRANGRTGSRTQHSVIQLICREHRGQTCGRPTQQLHHWETTRRCALSVGTGGQVWWNLTPGFVLDFFSLESWEYYIFISLPLLIGFKYCRHISHGASTIYLEIPKHL